MEFPNRVRDIILQKEDQDTSTSPTLLTPSSSSSSSHLHHHHHCPQQNTTTTTTSPSSSSSPAEQREHMFEKAVTPSDVGKLNRLVIPKQHAERFFPLDPASDDHKAGLLLNFEEGPTGKPWRFQYSYWNSSQSYVITKGWSRFVKDKRLDAGDTVSFSRSTSGSPRRLFIDWHRRPVPVLPPMVPTRGWTIPLQLPLYFRSSMGPTAPLILDSVPVRSHRLQPTIAEPRRHVRLFGVNLESSEAGPPPRNYNELQLMPPSTTTATKTTEEARR